MPTGYTAAIKDGISFKQFALDCARAFGACVTLRDEPGGGESIPDELAPSTYSKDKLKEAKGELARLEKMTGRACQLAADSDYDKGELARRARISGSANLLGKYQAMREAAESWTPPTSEHAEMKQFMLKQIDESIRFDCGSDFDEEPEMRLSADEWHQAAIRKQLSDIAYHAKSYAEEIERTNKRNAWIKALRESL